MTSEPRSPKKSSRSHEEVVDRSVDLIFRTAYAPVRINELLESADTRSRIRKISPPQLFFGLAELSDRQMQVLLPQITEEQWRAILDLSLWSRDRADQEVFLDWQRHLAAAVDPVLRKLWRATSPTLWELAIRQHLRISRQVDEDSYEGEVDEDASVFRSPDNKYLIQLPEDSEQALEWDKLLSRLFELESEAMGLLIEEALTRTPVELEEHAYQERCHRLEDLGFQEYFDAISIYTPIESRSGLATKQPESDPPTATLPEVPGQTPAELLLVRALGSISDQPTIASLLEELFFVCNKVISADSVRPGDSNGIRETIRKTLSGINLGLSLTSGNSLDHAIDSLCRHYLASLFQLGYGQLLPVQARAQSLLGKGTRGDLFEQAYLESLTERWPRPLRLEEGEVIAEYFWSEADLEQAHKQLEQFEAED